MQVTTSPQKEEQKILTPSQLNTGLHVLASQGLAIPAVRRKNVISLGPFPISPNLRISQYPGKTPWVSPRSLLIYPILCRHENCRHYENESLDANLLNETILDQLLSSPDPYFFSSLASVLDVLLSVLDFRIAERKVYGSCSYFTPGKALPFGITPLENDAHVKENLDINRINDTLEVSFPIGVSPRWKRHSLPYLCVRFLHPLYHDAVVSHLCTVGNYFISSQGFYDPYLWCSPAGIESLLPVLLHKSQNSSDSSLEASWESVNLRPGGQTIYYSDRWRNVTSLLAKIFPFLSDSSFLDVLRLAKMPENSQWSLTGFSFEEETEEQNMEEMDEESPWIRVLRYIRRWHGFQQRQRITKWRSQLCASCVENEIWHSHSLERENQTENASKATNPFSLSAEDEGWELRVRNVQHIPSQYLLRYSVPRVISLSSQYRTKECTCRMVFA